MHILEAILHLCKHHQFFVSFKVTISQVGFKQQHQMFSATKQSLFKAKIHSFYDATVPFGHHFDSSHEIKTQSKVVFVCIINKHMGTIWGEQPQLYIRFIYIFR